MKTQLQKLSAKVYNFSLIILSFAFLSSCDDKGNQPKANEATTLSSLQIFGFNDNVVAEGDGSSTTLYLTYEFNKEGVLTINRFSQADFNEGNLSNPIETRVGQFGLFTLGYVMNNTDLITKSSISYNANVICGTQNHFVQNYGDQVMKEDTNGKAIMDLHRDLKLFEFIANMHELGKTQFGESCISLEELRTTPGIILQKPPHTLRLAINLNYQTLSGKTGETKILLVLKPVLSLPVSVG